LGCTASNVSIFLSNTLLIDFAIFFIWENVGRHYETWETGITGPVLLHGLDHGPKDLTHNKWSYQVWCTRKSIQNIIYAFLNFNQFEEKLIID
jgi:hypothetical protein